MSSRYAPEPPTSGKVILNTSHGPINVELWTKEAPLASRNFIQLCLEGYYNNQAFYRVVPGFLVQTGDPEQTGEGGECIYGPAFADEFHSRLKFSHRGILAMATTRKNSNKSAFFFTLEATPWLNSQHTIFGKVSDDTMFNLLRIGETEIDKHDRPLTLPRILTTQVLVNPFDDIIPREKLNFESQKVPVQRPHALSVAPQLLSFDDELTQDIVSIHKPPQLLENHPENSSEKPLEKPTEILSEKPTEILSEKPTETLSEKPTETLSEKPTGKIRESSSEREKVRENAELQDEDFDTRMKKRVIEQKQKVGAGPNIEFGKYRVVEEANKIKVQTKKPPEEEFDELKSQLFLELKKRPRGTNNPEVTQEMQDEESFLSPLERRKYKYYQNSIKTKGREHSTMDKLNSFVQSLHKDNSSKWYSNKLKFSVDSSRAYSYKTESMTKLNEIDEDVIVDAAKNLRQRKQRDELPLDTLVTMEELHRISKEP